MKQNVRKILRDYYFGDLPTNVFAEWLYKDTALEKLFYDEYIDLISLDYKDDKECLRAKEIIRKIYDRDDPELLFKHKAIETAQGMLDSSVPLELGCAILGKISFEDDMEFIPIAFYGYDSEFKDEVRSEWFDMLGAYSERIKEECVRFLNEMEPYSKGMDN